jgi:hypothetical protein
MFTEGNFKMRRLLVSMAVAGMALTGACEVNQTKEAEAPDVDVNASGGQLPEFDVDAKEVVAGTTEKQVDVPDVDVKTEQKKVEVPTIEVK